jgi:flagellar hook-associated protein FlgK
MSLAATLANALSGLTVAQRALSVTANNIANANTEGMCARS